MKVFKCPNCQNSTEVEIKEKILEKFIRRKFMKCSNCHKLVWFESEEVKDEEPKEN